jgi:hypothetical protein
MTDATRKLIDECLASGTRLGLELAATAHLVEARHLLELSRKLQSRTKVPLHVVPNDTL